MIAVNFNLIQFRSRLCESISNSAFPNDGEYGENGSYFMIVCFEEFLLFALKKVSEHLPTSASQGTQAFKIFMSSIRVIVVATATSV